MHSGIQYFWSELPHFADSTVVAQVVEPEEHRV